MTTPMPPIARRAWRSSQRPRVRDAAGFTLVEVLVAVGLVAVLAAVALPSYQSQVRKSRRADAIALISLAQQAQERWRSNNAQYASSMTTLALPALSPGGYYTVTTAPLAGAELSTYTVTATARPPQDSDADCAVLRAISRAGAIEYHAGPKADALADAARAPAPRRCWIR